LSTASSKFSITFNLTFDMSMAPAHRRSQNHPYEVAGKDATTIKNLFGTSWLENNEWLVHEGYPPERIGAVERLEVSIPINEDESVVVMKTWSITTKTAGDFSATAQAAAWAEIFEEAEEIGRKNVAALEKERLRKRKWYKGLPQDEQGNHYRNDGSLVLEDRRPVRAEVIVYVVLQFS
jgi:hypothetical protein